MDNNILLLLENINNRLTIIEDKIDEIKRKQEDITNSSNKMDKHIDFIETVYENVKHPLNYISQKFNNSSNYIISS
jgi:archaellum component FlaC